MLCARDAYKIATENKKREEAKRIEDIIRAIESAVNKGKYEVYYNRDIEEDIQQLLYKLGYKITDCSNPMDGTEYKISWKF